MYLETDRHCRECACASCDLFQTDRCLEGRGLCDSCDNQSHTVYCPWHSDTGKEEQNGSVYRAGSTQV